MPIAQMKTNYKFPSAELRTAFLDEAAKELGDTQKAAPGYYGNA